MIADYSAAIKADAAEFEYRLARGIASHMAGESEGAIVDFSAALGIEPNSAAAHFRRGEAYVARGERDRAIADFDAAIAIEPTSAVAFHRSFYQSTRAASASGVAATWTPISGPFLLWCVSSALGPACS